jgi:hypothetical protein
MKFTFIFKKISNGSHYIKNNLLNAIRLFLFLCKYPIDKCKK